MAWTLTPPSTGTIIDAYTWIAQFWRATQERAWATGGSGAFPLFWPQPNKVWTGGTITGLTNNNDGTYTLTDSGASNVVNRYFGYTPPPGGFGPANYDLIIDGGADETQCFHTQILGNTATTFKITDIFADALTEGWLTSVSGLIGAKYYVIKRGGLWWHERWLIWPNDSEMWVGLNLTAGAHQPVTSLTSSGTTATATVPGHGFSTGDSVTIAGATSSNSHYDGTFTITATGTDTFTYTLAASDSSPAGGTITATEPHTGAYDSSASYTPGAYNSGFELMVYDNSSVLRRLTITKNDAQNLYFTRGSFTVSGQYAVVVAGHRYRHYQKFFQFNTSPSIVADCNPYAGPPFRWYHGPWDLYYSHYPDDSIGQTKSPTQTITINGNSGLVTEPIYDLDFWTAFDDPNGNPQDFNYTPDLYRTLRGIQDALETLCTFYVQPTSKNGLNAIPTFVPATWLNYAGINGLSVSSPPSTVDGSGGLNLGVTVSVPYTPIQVYYAVLNPDLSIDNWGIATLDTTSHLTWDSGVSGPFTTSEQGKTIIMSLGWTRKYPNEFLYLYPKQVFIPDSNGLGGWADPPTTTHPGSFASRGASTQYKETDAVGTVKESNGYRSFVTNDYARYSGDNWNDPTIHPETLVGSTSTPYTYYNNLYEGKLNPTNQAARDALKTGTVTGTPWRDNNSSIQDTSKNWWPGGVLGTPETGTATSGSTTDLADSSKSTNGFWTSMSGGRWVGMILQMTIGGTEYRRPIAFQSGTTDLQWFQATPASASGAAYQIRTPKYEVNTWAGRTLQLTFPDGSQHSTTINFNDDTCLYFDPLGVPIPTGTTYQIIEYLPGGVWKWNGSAWVVPTGNDPRGSGTTPWLADQTANLPTYNTRYGKLMKGDYIGPHIWSELYAAIQALVWLPYQITWTANGNTNEKSGSDGGEAIFANAVTNAKAAYNSSGSTSDAAPFALSFTDITTIGGNSCYSYDVARRYAFGQITSLDARQAASVDWYILAAIPTALDGSTGTLTASGPPNKEVFDDMGDGPPLQLGFYELVASSGPATAASRTSPQIGSLNMPADIGPASSPPDSNWFQGWMTFKSQAIVKKNVAGGFVYQ